MGITPSSDLSLYIHIPFCKSLCHFCNFVTFANKAKFIPAYLDALIQEIELRSVHHKNTPIETIYFGGGTPSLLTANQIEKILTAIKENFSVTSSPDKEISIECNPESLDLEKIKAYQAMGITRISLGIQSFDKKTLFRVGRPHDSKAIEKALQAIQQSGFKNFGTDFIIGLAYQTPESFEQEVKKILSIQPPHLSFYFLSYDTWRINHFSADCPPEEEQIKMYEYLTQALQEKGYLHYEVSNYAKPGFESKHNLRYWEQKDYLGLGLGAHSIVQNKSWHNTEKIEEYIKNPLTIEEEFEIDPETKKLEYIMLSLRTRKGINKKYYQETWGDLKKMLLRATEFIQSGHLKEDQNSLYPTEKGFLIIDMITKKLL